MKDKLILVCNDDGIHAPGIAALTEVATSLAEVIVVAPSSPMSGKGMSITLNSPLRYRKTEIIPNINGYSCGGTPVDCIKLAINKIVPRKPDLIVSGVNHGANSSINVIYSGTMSAAIEGALENIPSIGFSLLDHSIEADFSASKEIAHHIIKKILENGLPDHTCLNVNIPNLPLSEIKGIRICRQANGNWEEEFEERTDPYGSNYYWLTGKFVNYDKGEDTDIHALENRYVSVVPIQYDLTAHKHIDFLNSIKVGYEGKITAV